MAEFTSSPQVSPFPSQNILFNSASGLTGQELQKNQNALAGQQLDLSNANMEQVARASAGLLSAYPDEASRAAAYPRVVGMLQSQGFAKQAPATYPGEAVLRSLVNQGVPVADQYKMGLINAPGLTDALSRSNAPLAGPAGAAAPPTAGGGGKAGPAPFVGANLPAGVSPDEDQLVRTIYGEAGGEPVTGQQAVAHVIKTRMGLGKQGVQDVVFAPNQFEAWSDPKNRPRMEALEPGSPQYQAILNNVVRPVISGQAPDPTGGATNFYNPALQAQLGRSTPGFAVGNRTTIGNHEFYYGGYAPRTTTTDTSPAGAGGTAGGVQVASTAPVALPAAATEPQPSTATAPAPGTVPTAAAPAPTVAPASTAQPAPSSGTGVNSPQFQAALELNNRAAALETQYPYSPQAKAQVAALRAKAALYMQADSVSVDPATGIQTKQLTGERLNAAAPNAHYVWNEHQGAYVDTTGVHPPVTPPSPRLTIAPGGDVLQSKPGGGIAVVKPADPGAIQAQEAAKTSGAAAGTATGKLTATLADQGRSSAQAIGNIDYGLSQLDKAKAGGINTGYFAPWLSTVGAVAKSLGVPPQLIGVDPAAVGNIQTAQKTLAVVSGAILQQVLGPDSQITDAKLQHFIHAQPGIETDPEAVSRVLNWARSQFVYEREQAAQGMKDASATGVLPTNWQANYYDKHGFAPIYNPGTGEMQQPDGSAPPRQAPATMATAPVNPANRTVGTTYSTPKGPMKWTGTGWVAP